MLWWLNSGLENGRTKSYFLIIARNLLPRGWQENYEEKEGIG